MMAADTAKARNSRRTVLWIIVLAVAATATGLAAGAEAPVVIELPPADRQLLERVMGSSVVGKAVPAAPIQDPSAFFPLKPRTLTFLSTGDGRNGKRVEHSIRPRQQAGSGNQWDYATGPRDVAHLLLSADGSISVGSEEDGRLDILSQFTPGQPVLLKGMQPGETRKSKIDVRVRDRRQAERQAYSGWLQLTYTYLGSYQVQVPAGSYTTLLFKSHYQGKVGPASVKDTQYRFFAEGIGPVAVASQTDIRAYWLYHDVSTNARLLMRPAVVMGSR